MNSRMWGIIGGFALVLALLSPLVLGSTKKVSKMRLFETAEMLYEHDYERAIVKYSEALNGLLAKLLSYIFDTCPIST